MTDDSRTVAHEPRPREWDHHLLGIAAIIGYWRKGSLTDDGTARAIRAYLDDRDQAATDA